MSAAKNVYTVLERLTLPYGATTRWDETGLTLHFSRPFSSEFLPGGGYSSGFCRLPESPLPLDTSVAKLLGKHFAISAEDKSPPSGMKLFARWEIWSRSLAPKSGPCSLRLHWVKEVPDIHQYNSFDPEDSLRHVSPYDPHTEWHVAKHGQRAAGKIRLTRADEETLFATRPFTRTPSERTALLHAAEVHAAEKGCRRLMLVASADFTAELLAAEGYELAVGLQTFIPE